MGDADIAAARVPPHSVEAEQSVLGAVMLDNSAFDAVGNLLDTADFYVGQHRLIWRVCAELINACQPADIVTVFLRLQAAKQHDDAGGLVYLNRLVESVPGVRNVARYAAIVRQRSVCRQLVRVARELDDAAREAAGPGGDVAALIDRTALQLLDLQQGAPDDAPVLISALLPRWLDDLNDRAEGKTDAIPLGYPDLDRRMAGGARRGELVVIGARPSMGSTCATGAIGAGSRLLLTPDSDRLRSQPGCDLEFRGLVGPLPRQIDVGAAEVAVRGGRRVDRAQQVQIADDGARAQVEHLRDRLLDQVGIDVLGAEGLHEQADGCRLADGVGDLHLDAVG